MTHVIVVVPVHNRADLTCAFAQYLQAQSYRDFSLLLIDDGSTDATADRVLDIIPNARVFRGNGSLWWAGCLALAFDELKKMGVHPDSLLLLINDDVEFGTDFLANAVQFMRTKRRTLLLAQNVVSDHGPQETGVHADLGRFSFEIARTPGDINCLSTRGLFGHWETFMEIGDFRPRLLPHYNSDYEYTMRAYGIGIDLVTDSSVCLSSNDLTTGVRRITGETALIRLRSLFSIRATENPRYLCVFAILTVPIKWLPRALCVIWLRSFRLVVGPSAK